MNVLNSMDTFAIGACLFIAGAFVASWFYIAKTTTQEFASRKKWIDQLPSVVSTLQNSKYGLPKDMVQQKEWIQQGADNGNPRFVLAMAEMYEANAEWHDAYNWYKTLEKVAPQLLNDTLDIDEDLLPF